MPRILLLDDDSRFRKLTAVILAKRGYEVVQASNGAEARNIMQAVGADLVVVDFRLSDCDGIQWISWLRETGAKLPVIFLSGFRCDNRMLSMLRNVLQVSIVLQKPIRPGPFLSIIDAQLRESGNALKKWLGSTSLDDYTRQIEESYHALGMHVPTSTVPKREEHAPEEKTSGPHPICLLTVDVAPGEVVITPAPRRENSDCEVAVLGTENIEDSWKSVIADAEWQRVASDYFRELSAKLFKLAENITTARAGRTELLNDILSDSHSLRGNAALFGFPEVGEQMGVIEDILMAATTHGSELQPACEWAQIETAIEVAMNAAAERLTQ